MGHGQATAASRHHSPSHLCCVPQKPSSPSSPRPPTEPDVPPHLTDNDTEAQKAAVISPGHVGWSARLGPESGLPTPRHQGLFPTEQTRSPEHTERAMTGLPPGQDPGGQLDIADTSQLGEGGKCLLSATGPEHTPCYRATPTRLPGKHELPRSSEDAQTSGLGHCTGVTKGSGSLRPPCCTRLSHS